MMTVILKIFNFLHEKRSVQVWHAPFFARHSKPLFVEYQLLAESHSLLAQGQLIPARTMAHTRDATAANTTK